MESGKVLSTVQVPPMGEGALVQGHDDAVAGPNHQTTSSYANGT